MEKSYSLLNLYDDIYVEIFSFFTPKDFINLSCSCQHFKKLLESGNFWKAYTTKLGSRALITSANITVSSNHFYEFFKLAVKTFYKKETQSGPLGTLQTLVPVEASSTDFSQSIDKVLQDTNETFWSSLGSDSEDSVEHLLFLFSRGFVVPFSVYVTFFTAAGFYTEGTFEFPCKQVEVQFSFDGMNWEYGSEKVDVNGRHEVEIKILGKVGLARYMRVLLDGKTTRQPGDELFYVAVQNIKCYGYKIDVNDKNNEALNDLLITSYTWKQTQSSHKLGNQDMVPEDRIKEILDYHKSQTFFSSIYIKFLSNLKDQDKEAIWEYLETHKFLLTVERSFIDIYQTNKDFAIYYLTKVVKTKKRKILTCNESLMLIMLYLDFHNDEAGFTDILQVISNQYHVPELLEIKTLQLSTNTFIKIIQVLGVGHQAAITYLKNAHKVLYDEPEEYELQTASIVLFNYLMISKYMTQTQQ